MTGTEIVAAIGAALKNVLDFGAGIVGYLSKGKVDATELARMQHEYDMAVQALDVTLAQAKLWLQQSLIEMEKATGARWRPPLILASGFALVLAALNNILAACYFSWAHPVDMTSAPMLVLAGMLLLLVTGDAKMLIGAFSGKSKPADNNSSAKTKEK